MSNAIGSTIYVTAYSLGTKVTVSIFENTQPEACPIKSFQMKTSDCSSPLSKDYFTLNQNSTHLDLIFDADVVSGFKEYVCFEVVYNEGKNTQKSTWWFEQRF